MHPVSLVICTYNREDFLPMAIESVLNQTYREFELVIWDDASSDRSLEIAQAYAKKDSRIRVFAAQHQGIAHSLQGAISQTSGLYLGWVDSDDWLASTALEKTVALLEAKPDVGVVYTHYWVVDEQGRNYGLGNRCQVPYSQMKLLVEFMTFHFRLIRRSVYEQVGGVSLLYEQAEDYDLCLRLSEVTAIETIPEPLYYYRRHGHNVTNQELKLFRSSYQAVSAALKRRGLDKEYYFEFVLSEINGHFQNQLRLKRHPSMSGV
jgi:glycosyltransferase involved in cell wall biosynthesis